jgi:hypothetical protein
MNLKQVRAEFARSAMQFHKNEPLDKIKLWGLFYWCDVSKYIKSGKIIPNTGYTKANKVIWCKPSKKEIENYSWEKTSRETFSFIINTYNKFKNVQK